MLEKPITPRGLRCSSPKGVVWLQSPYPKDSGGVLPKIRHIREG